MSGSRTTTAVACGRQGRNQFVFCPTFQWRVAETEIYMNNIVIFLHNSNDDLWYYQSGTCFIWFEFCNICLTCMINLVKSQSSAKKHKRCTASTPMSLQLKEAFIVSHDLSPSCSEQTARAELRAGRVLCHNNKVHWEPLYIREQSGEPDEESPAEPAISSQPLMSQQLLGVFGLREIQIDHIASCKLREPNPQIALAPTG